MSKFNKSEFWLGLAGVIAVVATSTLESGILAPIPTAAAIVGVVSVVASYIAGRSWVKGKEADAKGRELSLRAPSLPSLRTPPNP